MASSDSQIDKQQRGRPERAELLDVNVNTVAQSINTERASLRKNRSCVKHLHYKDCSEMHSGSCSQMTSSRKWRQDRGRLSRDPSKNDAWLVKPVSQPIEQVIIRVHNNLALFRLSWRRFHHIGVTLVGIASKPVSQSCAVVESETLWRATGQSNLAYGRLAATKASKV